MALPSVLQGESITRLLQGTVFGAVASMIVGFNWGGWTLDSTALKQADKQSQTAVVSALAPICVQNFQSSTDAVSSLAALKEQSTYKRTGYIEDGGWAILPGNDKAGNGVAKACAQILNDL